MNTEAKDETPNDLALALQRRRRLTDESTASDGGIFAEFRSKDPGGFFVSAFITGPTDQIQEFATAPTVDLGVENFGDLVLWFTVDFDGRRRCLDASGDGVRRSGFQLRDVKDRMDGSHGVW